MDAIQLTDKLKQFILNQIDQAAESSPMIGLIRPLVTRGINKNIGKITSMLELITDENGQIDAYNIMGEMLISLSSSAPFTLNVPLLGDVEFGEGCIKMNIPMTTKRLVVDKKDLEQFKETLNT